MKKISLSILIILLMAFIAFCIALSKYEITDDVYREAYCSGDIHYPLIRSIDTSGGEIRIRNSYIKMNTFCNVRGLENDITELKKITKNKSTTDSLIFDVLAYKLYNRDSGKIKNLDLSLLSDKFQWAEKFYFFSEIDSTNADLFLGVYDFWIGRISDILRDHSVKQPDIIYTKQFNYLVARCNEKTYSVPVKVSNTQKFLHNLLNDKWSHLISATWSQSSLFQKIIFLLVFLVTVFSYYYSLSKLLFKNEKK